MKGAHLHVASILAADLVESSADLSERSNLDDFHQLGEDVATALCRQLQTLERFGCLRSVLSLESAQAVDLMDVEPAVVNIKATTTEGMGFIGRKEGLAALAVAPERP